MADVNTYKRCTMTHVYAGNTYLLGEIRVGTDAATLFQPQWWVALTDAEMSGKLFHAHG